jgi:hypothetical protein
LLFLNSKLKTHNSKLSFALSPEILPDAHYRQQEYQHPYDQKHPLPPLPLVNSIFIFPQEEPSGFDYSYRAYAAKPAQSPTTDSGRHSHWTGCINRGCFGEAELPDDTAVSAQNECGQEHR